VHVNDLVVYRAAPADRSGELWEPGPLMGNTANARESAQGAP